MEKMPAYLELTFCFYIMIGKWTLSNGINFCGYKSSLLILNLPFSSEQSLILYNDSIW